MKKKKYLLPIIFMLIMCISIFLFNYGNDFYWHLRTGSYIVENRKIPFTDIFSWYAKSNHLSWISHEWLFEVILYSIFYIFSNVGIFFFVLLIIGLIGFILFQQKKEIFYKYPFQTIYLALIGMLVFANKTMPRPHLLSFLFFTITLFFAYDNLKNKNSKLIYFAPLISLLWSNCHGGSSNLSYIIYTIFFIVHLFPIRFKNIKKQHLERKQLFKYLYAFLSSIFVIPLNPHGIKMLFYPYLNMTYTTMIHCIDEWQWLNLLSVDGFFYFLFILFIFYTIVHSKKEHQLIDLLLLIIFTILGVKSTRFIPYLFIVVTNVIPKYWYDTKVKIDLYPIFVSLVGIIFIFYSFVYVSPKFQLISDSIIHYLTEKDNVILYNSYNLGGYLIYQGIPVFIDGRADLYVDSILCDVCSLEKENDTSIFEKYHFNTFVVENKSKANQYLKNHHQYKLIMNDGKNSLYILN